MGMASNRPSHPRRKKTMDPEESPEVVHRVALHVGAMVECQKWMKRSLELKHQGDLKASEAAATKARKFLEFIFEVQSEADIRQLDAAASKLARHTLGSGRTH
jgi:hypothetical protein